MSIPLMLEGSDKLARDAFVHSVKVFTSLVLSYASIISHNSGAPTEMSVSGSTISYNSSDDELWVDSLMMIPTTQADQ